MIAGFNIGYGQVKAYFGANGNDGMHCFPRVIAEAQGPEWGKLNETDTYAINGARYVIGEDALSYTENILRRESRDFVLEETYWACLGKTLADNGLFTNGNSEPIRIGHIAMGVAPGHYDSKIQAEMKRRIRSGIEMWHNRKEIRFSTEKVSILPHGAGAYFETMLTDAGTITDLDKRKLMFGILDIGYRTTDYVLFDKAKIITVKELSEDTGVRGILEKILRYVVRKFDYADRNPEYLEPLLRGKPFACHKGKIDLSGKVAEIVADHFRKRIEPDLRKRWESRLERMEKIIVCGGGAHLLKMVPDFMKGHEQQISIPDNPEMSNAVGFYRYAAMEERRKG